MSEPMYRMKWLALFFAVALVLPTACQDDPSNNGTTDTGANDTGTVTDTADPEDGVTDSGGSEDSTSDTSQDTGDATDEDSGADVSSQDASDTAADTSEDTQEDTARDTADAGDPYADRPIGQCTQNSDCPDGPNGRVCSEALPGGACQGCGSDADCPAIASCSQFGTCVGDCSDDADCAPGLYCTGSGRCAAQSCVNGECPVPLFGCSDSDRCERIDCSSDASLCPEDTTCTNGWCIEDRALQ